MCDKFVCDKFVCDKVVCDKVVCDKVVGDKEDAEEEAEEGYAGGCQSKNKNPTQFGGEKVSWKHQFHCARKTRQNRMQSDDARTRDDDTCTRRASEPTVLRNGSSVDPKK